MLGGIIAAVFLVAASTIYASNYFGLQRHLNQVLQGDPRNSGLAVTVHYGSYVNPSVLVYDLRSVAPTNSAADVFRVLLQYSERVQDQRFTVVELAYRGKTKFLVPGAPFQTLGRQYASQNPMYLIRTFPENLKSPDGSAAFPQWEGGLLGVALKQFTGSGIWPRHLWDSEDAPPPTETTGRPNGDEPWNSS